MVLGDKAGYLEEQHPRGARRYAIEHVMGGKNTFYFLTPMDRGRLQVLPLAYDVQQKKWYDMAASGVRMHAEGPTERPLAWTDSAFTFNTACYSCHVSHLNTNYDLASDAYRTTWKEPGINCQTCHGDGEAHVALYKKDPSAKHEDMKILRTTRMTTAQRNELCAPCHAKMSPLGSSYQVTQRFFDHYDLVTLEDSDYYPDGRDLGENYTYTSWMMSPCVKAGKLDCIHCHTSSGRYKFATGNPNAACLPCHQDRVANAQSHTRHKPGTPGGQCIDCHMPKTRFANMNRSDHSMLPPTPAATLRYKSPNACNLCHKHRDARWADAKVRQWHKDDFQKPVMERAALVDAARKAAWRELPAMVSYIRNPSGELVTQASLLRLLRSCDDPRKTPALIEALHHASPLIRAAAVSSFSRAITAEIRDALARAAGDEFRLVRIRAASAIAAVPLESLPEAAQESIRKATAELIGSFMARPDDFANHTNLGNFYLDRGQVEQSIQSFETAIRLRPDSVGTLVNASMAYSRASRLSDAERVLGQALREAPENAAANFNLGLLLAETGRAPQAKLALHRALKSDPSMAAAAYNLCVLTFAENKEQALDYCRQAARIAPGSEKYASSLAYYLVQTGNYSEALEALNRLKSAGSSSSSVKAMMGDLCIRLGKKQQASQHFAAALDDPGLPADQRAAIAKKLQDLRSR
jgi:tetratricopeptide (TPR) repeat protein